MLKKQSLPNYLILLALLIGLFTPTSVITKPSVGKASPPYAPEQWYGPDWLYRKEITIDHTQVSADLTDFPVLVYIDADAGLAAEAQSNGDDLLFTDSSDVKLDHEIEFFDSSNGELVAWVKAPLVQSSVDTTIYLYYGNPYASSQENAAGVWDNDYVMIQHLSETSGTHYDSTANSNDGTPLNGLIQGVTGITGGAAQLDGVDDFIDVGTDTSLDVFGPNHDFSIFLWVKRSATNDIEGFFSSGSGSTFGIYFGSASQNTDDMRFMSTDNSVNFETTSGTIGDTEWHLVGLTADRNGNLSFWADGALEYTQSISGLAGEAERLIDAFARDEIEQYRFLPCRGRRRGSLSSSRSETQGNDVRASGEASSTLNKMPRIHS